MQPIDVTKNFPLLVNLLMVLLSVWMVSGWMVSGSTSLQAFNPPEMSGQRLPDMAGIQGNLFGVASVVSAAGAPAVVIPVVKAPLNIKLLGTVLDGSDSAAVIAMAGREDQKGFFAGSTIEPGVKLHEVLADAIVLDRGGVLEKVMMQKSGGVVAASMEPGLLPQSAARRPEDVSADMMPASDMQ